jgi:hypothetical protein
MYWTMAKKVVGEKYKPPTKIVSDEINFDTWSNLAKDADKNLLPPSRPHQYFMAGSQRSDDVRNFIHRDLSVFRSDSPNLFIPTPDRNKGAEQSKIYDDIILDWSHYYLTLYICFY